MAVGIGQAIQLGGQIAQIGIGIAQRHKGKKLEEATERPDYEIPAEVFQNLSQAQQMALQGLPAAQKAQYLQNLQQSGQFALSQSGSRKAGLTGLGQMQQQQNYGFQSLLAQDSAARQQNQMQVMQQRQNVAGYRDQSFQLNQLNPFYEDIAHARGLQSAGMQNIQSGIGNVGYQAQQMQQQPQQNAMGMAGQISGAQAGGFAGQVLGGAAAYNTGNYVPPPPTSAPNQFQLNPVQFNY